MNLSHLLYSYGYLAVFLIRAINLSAGLIVASFAAHQGYLSVYLIIIIACLGSFMFTEIYSLVSRFGMAKYLIHHPRAARQIEKFNKKFSSKNGVLIAGFLFRFISGFRMMTPFLLGSMKESFLVFSVSNFIGAVAWALVFSLVG